MGYMDGERRTPPQAMDTNLMAAPAVGGPRHQKENEHREGVENGVLAG